MSEVSKAYVEPNNRFYVYDCKLCLIRLADLLLLQYLITNMCPSVILLRYIIKKQFLFVMSKLSLFFQNSLCCKYPLWPIALRYSPSLLVSIFQRPMTTNKAAKQRLKSPLLQEVITPELLTVTNAFKKGGYDIRLVGGVVRDLLLGVPSKDIDLSTNATPEQMIEVFKSNGIKFIETGLEHGTITAHVNSLSFEVTTLRYDTEQDGRWAKVVFTNDWKLDAERRDLTINAMSMDLDFWLYDYFGGMEDLKCHCVRFVGNAKQRIHEDYLRILRYFRFYGRIASGPDNHDEDTLKVIEETAPGLQRIAVERIWMELSKILTGNFAPSILRHIYDLKVAKHIGKHHTLTKDKIPNRSEGHV